MFKIIVKGSLVASRSFRRLWGFISAMLLIWGMIGYNLLPNVDQIKLYDPNAKWWFVFVGMFFVGGFGLFFWFVACVEAKLLRTAYEDVERGDGF